MKKSLSLLVAIAMVFSMFAAVASAAEKQSAGEYLQEIGVIKGNLEGNLNEDKEWKREDLTVLLSRLLGVEKAASEHANTHGFTDVTNSFYDGYISWAKEEGLMIGKTETTFGYNAPLTNQHFAAVVLRALKIEAEYDDVPKVAVEKKLVAEGTDFKANALRGVTYDVIVTALNTEVTGTGKKLGTILGLKGFEITALVVDAVTAPNRATVIVDFNTEVGEVKATNFSIHEKGDQYATKTIDKVAAEGDKVTLTLNDVLANEKEYVVVVNNLKNKAGDFTLDTASKEFTYVKTNASAISFGQTTYGIGNVLKVVIKDANGNDITPNYNLADALELQSSSPSVVDKVAGEIKALTEGFSVVNVKLIDSELETGNTIINVKKTLNTVTTISKVTIGDLAEDKLAVYTNSVGKSLDVEVKDQNGDVLTKDVDYKLTFRSNSPTILVVDQTGHITPVAAGTASVTIFAKDENQDRTISKNVNITVKAAPKATTINVTPANAKLVIGSIIEQDLKVEVLDQYGDLYTPVGTDPTQVKFVSNRDGVVAGLAKDQEVTATVTNGKASLTIAAGSNTEASSATVKVSYGSLSKNVAVSLVKGGNFAGYVAVAGDTTLDLNADSQDKKRKGPNATEIRVFSRDASGNYLEEVTANAALKFSDNKEVVLPGATTSEVKGNKVGTENVFVEINGVRIATIAFTVVKTSPVLTSVTQNNSSINVLVGSDKLTEKIIGEVANNNGGIFVAYDQYGEKINIRTADYAFISSNLSVVSVSADKKEVTVVGEGEAQLTLVVESGKVYTVVVKVKKA